MSDIKFRPLKFGVTRVKLRDGPPGTHYLEADQALQAFPDRLTDRLQHWAQTVPERSFMARRVKQADGTETIELLPGKSGEVKTKEVILDSVFGAQR